MSDHTKAAPAFDYVNGTYADDFANTTGIVSSSQSGVNGGVVQLKNSGGTYTAPYLASGYIITQSIIPTSVSAWGTFSYVGDVPENTTVKIQVMDDANSLFGDYALPGNSTGFSSSSLDLSALSPLAGGGSGKKARLRFKILFTTSDTGVTPTIDSIAFNWTPKSAVLPTASTLYNSGWTTFYGNSKGTAMALYDGAPTYPVIRWQSEEFPKSWFTYANHPIIYEDNVYYSSWPREPLVRAINRNTGATIWQKAWAWIYYEGAIDQNGILYNADYAGSDLVYAIDMKTGEVKWTKQYGGGHGSDMAVIGKDGIIFSARATGVEEVNGPIILDAYYPNGTVKYSQSFAIPVGTTGEPGHIAVASDGTLYLGIKMNLAVDNQEAMFYAINPDDGSTKWSYQTGTMNRGNTMKTHSPIIDSQGNIYVYQLVNTAATFDPKMISLDPDGNLRWERSVDRTLYLGWSNVSMGKDDKIIAARLPRSSSVSDVLEVIDPATGNLIHSQVGFADPGLNIDSLTTDSNYIYASGSFDTTYNETILRVMDYDLNDKWTITNPYLLDGTTKTKKQFDWFSEDERGWLYGTFFKTVFNGAVRNEALSTSRVVGIAPWTLSSDISSASEFHPSDTIDFTVTTSMQQTNVFSGGANQMQIVLANDEKIPLTYSQTLGSGDTEWTASYQLPAETAAGEYSYTIEANADYIATDIATNFASPATNSNNTGFTSQAAYTVIVTPTLTTQAATSVQMHKAILNGNVTVTGGENATTRGFKYYQSTDCTGAENDKSENGNFGTGAFALTATSFVANKDYSYKAYAINSAGTGLGTCVSFMTPPNRTYYRSDKEPVISEILVNTIQLVTETVEKAVETFQNYFIKLPFAPLDLSKKAGEEQSEKVAPLKPTVEGIEVLGHDLLIRGKAQPNTIIYLEIHSNPIFAETNTDDKGNWNYLVKNAKDILGTGDHTVLASAAYALGDSSELKSEVSKTYDFKVSLDGDKLEVEMKKTKIWQYISLGLVLIIIVGFALKQIGKRE